MIHHLVRSLLCMGLLVHAAQAELTIYYVRHAEGGHNVLRQFKESDIPKDQWPAYVGNHDIFTPLGIEQVATLTESLPDIPFDFIAVSPTWRTRNTILPYLKKHGYQGEIWPELAEIKNFYPPEEPPPEPPGDSFFQGIGPVQLDAGEEAWFHLRPDEAGQRLYAGDTLGRVQYMTQRIEDLLRERFGPQDATVLLVGHATASAALLRQLTRNPAFKERHIGNTRIWVVQENEEGSFSLKVYNQLAPDLPVSLP